jgi:polyisoprenoid-binding protein YceI
MASLALGGAANAQETAAPAAAAASKAVELGGQMKFLSDAPVEKIFGTVDGVTGKLTTDAADLSKTTGKFVVPVPAMKTGNDKRDEHLRSDQWLDAAKFPEITFDVKSVKVLSDDKAGPVRSAKLEATGDFTVHGVTVPLTAPVDIKWKDDKVKATTKFNVKLADHQITGANGVIGKKVGETIQIEGTLQGTAR